MLFFHSILFVIPLLCGIVQTVPSGKCPRRNGQYVHFLQDTVSASQFYMCDYGVPILFNCPTSLVFNTLINVRIRISVKQRNIFKIKNNFLIGMRLAQQCQRTNDYN